MQSQLFYDTYEDALRDTVTALGGLKKAGNMLWPAMAVDEAGRKLSHCLNADKREKLCPNEVALLRREARKVGCHILAAFEMRDAGYSDPVPVEPEDEQAALRREYVEAVKAMAVMTKRMERAGMLGVTP